MTTGNIHTKALTVGGGGVAAGVLTTVYGLIGWATANPTAIVSGSALTAVSLIGVFAHLLGINKAQVIADGQYVSRYLPNIVKDIGVAVPGLSSFEARIKALETKVVPAPIQTDIESIATKVLAQIKTDAANEAAAKIAGVQVPPVVGQGMAN